MQPPLLDSGTLSRRLRRASTVTQIHRLPLIIAALLTLPGTPYTRALGTPPNPPRWSGYFSATYSSLLARQVRQQIPYPTATLSGTRSPRYHRQRESSSGLDCHNLLRQRKSPWGSQHLRSSSVENFRKLSFISHYLRGLTATPPQLT